MPTPTPRNSVVWNRANSGHGLLFRYSFSRIPGHANKSAKFSPTVGSEIWAVRFRGVPRDQPPVGTTDGPG